MHNPVDALLLSSYLLQPMKNLLVLFVVLATLTKAFAQTDTTIGLSIPGNYGTDVDAIAASICIDMTTERQKANAIYNWVTHNIAYDVNAMYKLGNSDDDKVAIALKTKKAICGGYAELYAALCRSVGLGAVVVEGYAKDFLFDNGDEIYIPRHGWNAVRIDGKWQLVDATWGAGSLYQKNSWLRMLLNKLLMQKKLKAKNLKFKFAYDPQYFSQDPEVFRLKHIPLDPLWQLTDTIMPLAIFEAGDSAVKKFNLISKPAQSSPVLDKIATLPQKQKDFELADRAYAYNSRYQGSMAYKNSLLADSTLKRITANTDVKIADSLVKSATGNMKTALDLVKKQKKNLPEEYMKLNRKNKAKSMEAKQYVRQIKTDDKRLLAECKKHSKSSDSKYDRARKKMADVQKRKRTLNTGYINDIQTNKTPKKAGSPELEAIEDSVLARNTRLEVMLHDIKVREASAKELIQANSKLVDSLATSLSEEDSLLRNEAIERLSMHDSYDDEVKLWSNLFKQQKYRTTDTLMKYYFAGFDSVSAKFEDLQKSYTAALNTYKNNVRSLEQYKKWNEGDADLKSRYSNMVTEYGAAIDSASQSINLYGAYLKANKKIFAALTKVGKHQLTIVDYMEKAEKSRQELESRTLARKKYIDLKENEKQRNSLQKAIKELDRADKSISKQHM